MGTVSGRMNRYAERSSWSVSVSSVVTAARAAATNVSSRCSVRPVAVHTWWASRNGKHSESISYLRSHSQGSSARSRGS